MTVEFALVNREIIELPDRHCIRPAKRRKDREKKSRRGTRLFRWSETVSDGYVQPSGRLVLLPVQFIAVEQTYGADGRNVAQAQADG